MDAVFFDLVVWWVHLCFPAVVITLSEAEEKVSPEIVCMNGWFRRIFLCNAQDYLR